MIVLLVIASLVVRYLPLYHSTSPHPEWNTPCGADLSRYNSNGQQLTTLIKGINIIKYSDGSIRKVIATSGPGATNLVTGIATAHLDSVPLVAITGNVPCSLLGRDSFQEVDIMGITMPITKHNFIVKDVTKLADTSVRS